MAKRQKRFEVLAERPINKDGFIKEWVDVGLVAMESPNDPKPSIKIENGIVVELDGKRRDDFDMIDFSIADYCIDKRVAEEAMAIDSVITSYSIHYTKLYDGRGGAIRSSAARRIRARWSTPWWRGRRACASRAWRAPSPPPLPNCRTSVITSYSIHYTKLYDEEVGLTSGGWRARVRGSI